MACPRTMGPSNPPSLSPCLSSLPLSLLPSFLSCFSSHMLYLSTSLVFPPLIMWFCKWDGDVTAHSCKGVGTRKWMWRTLGKTAQAVGGDPNTVSSVKDTCFRHSKRLTFLKRDCRVPELWSTSPRGGTLLWAALLWGHYCIFSFHSPSWWERSTPSIALAT